MCEIMLSDSLQSGKGGSNSGECLIGIMPLQKERRDRSSCESVSAVM